MAKIKKEKSKYKIGQIVYCRPFMVSGNGMKVYKCMITAINYMSSSPYYSLKCLKNNINLHVRYEKEISIRSLGFYVALHYFCIRQKDGV